MPQKIHPWNTKNRPAVGRISCLTELGMRPIQAEPVHPALRHYGVWELVRDFAERSFRPGGCQRKGRIMIYRSSAILAILVLGLGATVVVADNGPGDPPLGEVRVTINAPSTVNEGENIALTYTCVGDGGDVVSQWWGLYGTNTPTGYNPHTYFDNWLAVAPIAREMNARYSPYPKLQIQVNFSVTVHGFSDSSEGAGALVR